MSRRGEQLLTLILAGSCGVLFLLALLLEFGVGRGYSWLPADAESPASIGGGAVDRSSFKLPPQTDFSVTYERPLFNEDRKPAPDVADTTDTVVPPQVPLNVTLTGTVQSPGLRMAMLRDNAKNQAYALREGMPLPGDLGGWTLTHIKARSVTFKSTGGEDQEVELTVAGPGQKGAAQRPLAPGAPATFGPGPGTATTPPSAPQQAQQGVPPEELQRRVEERRRQMREAAERTAKQKPPQPGQSQPEQL